MCSTAKNQKIVECMNCNRLYLTQKDVGHIICESCENSDIRIASQYVLIRCNTCSKYWSPWVLKSITNKTLMQCPDNTCDGNLQITDEWTEAEFKRISVLSQGYQIEVHEPLREKQESEKKIERRLEKEEELLDEVDVPLDEVDVPLDEVDVPLDVVENLDEGVHIHIEKPQENIPELKKLQLESLNLNLDPAQISLELIDDVETLNAYLQVFKSTPADYLTFSQEDYMQIFATFLSKIKDAPSEILVENIQNVFYVGDIRGDYKQLQLLINYFSPILEIYPSIKIVFLGNYLGWHKNDFEMFAMLQLFYLTYPENITLLRGNLDFHSKLKDRYLGARIQKILNVADADAIRMYQVILHILSFLPIIHIGLMDQGKIRVYSASRGIPVDQSNLDVPVDIIKGKFNSEFPINLVDNLDPKFRSLFTSKIDKNSVPSALDFMNANRIQYFINSGEGEQIPDGVDYILKHAGCSIFSTKNFKIPELNLNTTFKPCILRLSPGNAPKSLATDQVTLEEDLLDTFNINFDEMD